MPAACQNHVATLHNAVSPLSTYQQSCRPQALLIGAPKSLEADTRRRSKGELEKRAPWVAWWKERQQKERELNAQRDAAQSSGELRRVAQWAPQDEAVERSHSGPYPHPRGSSSNQRLSHPLDGNTMMLTRMMAGMESPVTLGLTTGPLHGRTKGGTTTAGVSNAIKVLVMVPTMTRTTTGGTMSLLGLGNWTLFWAAYMMAPEIRTVFKSSKVLGDMVEVAESQPAPPAGACLLCLPPQPIYS